MSDDGPNSSSLVQLHIRTRPTLFCAWLHWARAGEYGLQPHAYFSIYLSGGIKFLSIDF